jgi:hypothetical protein
VNNDLHENLLNGMTNLDEKLLGTRTDDVLEERVVELIQGRQEIAKRKRREESIIENNEEPKKKELKMVDKNQETNDEDFDTNEIVNERKEELEKMLTIGILIEWKVKSKTELDGIPAYDQQITAPSCLGLK